MSQKVHPKGFRLRTTPQTCYADPTAPESSSWDSVWFSEPKKGKHLYTRLSHEDQLIQKYTKGFFRSFGFYQQKCTVERKCNKELHITSYVLRTPKLQAPNVVYRSPKEKTLQLGLEQGWIPNLILQIIGKILYSQTARVATPIRITPHRSYGPKATGTAPSIGITSPRSGNGPIQSLATGHSVGSTVMPATERVPSTSAIVTPQESSPASLLTERKRFFDFWNTWSSTRFLGENNTFVREACKGPFQGDTWWSTRSWSSALYFPQTLSKKAITTPASSLSDFTNAVTRSSNYASSITFEQVGAYRCYTTDPSKIKVIYSIQPTQSLISSSQLIADYMADKIEQSVSIQQLFNELLRFFETEAECLGPAFEVKSGVSNGNNNATELPKILGFRIVCSGRLQMSSFSKPAEKAESITITRGVLPLNTMKANIDFAQTYSTNPYGTCGIKVWVNRG
jgi:hypothetical protein